jgi:hypothetical protein
MGRQRGEAAVGKGNQTVIRYSQTNNVSHTSTPSPGEVPLAIEVFVTDGRS